MHKYSPLNWQNAVIQVDIDSPLLQTAHLPGILRITHLDEAIVAPFTRIATLGLVWILTARSVDAGLVSAADFGTADFIPISNVVVGWEFTALADISVVSLGVYDSSGNGLANRPDVGLWQVQVDALGNVISSSLLSSVTIPAGTAASLIEGFRYVDIAPIALTAGNRYSIGALIRPSAIIGEIDLMAGPTGPGEFSHIAQISTPQGRSSNSTTLVVPSVFVDVGDIPLFGPNFRADVSEVPEPASALLWGAGILLVGAGRRRLSRTR